MAEKEKILEKLKDEEYIKSVIVPKDIREIKFKIDGAPIPYTRERKGRGKHFYNPKGNEMRKIREKLKNEMSKEDREFMESLIQNPEKEYYVAISARYYREIPKGTSIKNAVRMMHGDILPSIRPDLDNYGKFLLDMFHDLLYEDDKRVISLDEKKLYDIEAHTEITATVIYNKE